MGNTLLSVFLLSFIFLSNVVLSHGLIDMNQDREVMLALEIAADAGVTKWDKEATAEAGMIVLEPDNAIDAAKQQFERNIKNSAITSNQLVIEVVNNAPITKVVDGQSVHFQANGIIVSYGDYAKVREVDDR